MSETGRVKAVAVIKENTQAYGDMLVLAGTQGKALQGTEAGKVNVDWDWAMRRNPTTQLYDVMEHIICQVPADVLVAAG